MIEVRTFKDNTDKYPADAKWKIDEERQLHIWKGDAQLGSYGVNSWESVRDATQPAS